MDIPAGHGSSRVPPTRLIDPAADRAEQPKSQGMVLYWRQFWALFVKRAISAKRDRLAVVLQLLVPILLVLLALRAGNASSAMVQEPSLDISRYAKRFVTPMMQHASTRLMSPFTASHVMSFKFMALLLPNSS